MGAPGLAALLDDLCARKVALRASGSRLVCSPRTALDDDLRERIRANKPGLLTVLGRRARAEKLVHRAVSRAVLLRHLPRLLDWLSDHRPEVFHRQEEQGLILGEVWTRFELGEVEEESVRKAARLWSHHLQEGARYYAEKHLYLEPNPIWAFWTCYTRREAQESPLSRFLREEVGYEEDQRQPFAEGEGRSG